MTPELHEYLNDELTKLPPHSPSFILGMRDAFEVFAAGLTELDARNPYPLGTTDADAYQLGAVQCRSIFRSAEYEDGKLRQVVAEARDRQRRRAVWDSREKSEWQEFADKIPPVLKGSWFTTQAKALVKEIDGLLETVRGVPFGLEESLEARTEVRRKVAELLALPSHEETTRQRWLLSVTGRTALFVLYVLVIAYGSIWWTPPWHSHHVVLLRIAWEVLLMAGMPTYLKFSFFWDRRTLKRALKTLPPHNLAGAH